jgi:hypothetical protein
MYPVELEAIAPIYVKKGPMLPTTIEMNNNTIKI